MKCGASQSVERNSPGSPYEMMERALSLSGQTCISISPEVMPIRPQSQGHCATWFARPRAAHSKWNPLPRVGVRRPLRMGRGCPRRELECALFVNVSQTCRFWGVSPRQSNTWLHHYSEHGLKDLKFGSRKPHLAIPLHIVLSSSESALNANTDPFASAKDAETTIF